MKSNVKKILFIVISFLFLVFLNTKVNAASANIECSGEVEVNKPITISVKGSGVQWNLKLIVDGNVIVTSSELENYESNKTISFSKEYTPTTPDPVVDPNPGQKPDQDPEQKPNTDPGTTTPDPEPTKGTVSRCRINGIKVNQYLNVKNKESVSVQVDTSTKEGLKIYNDKTKMTYNAKSGQIINVQIVEGEQTLTITLDTGYKTTRRIISTKEGEETPPNVIEEPTEEEKVILKSLSLKGVNREEKVDFTLEPEFSSEVYEYTLNIPKEQNDITKLEIEAIADKEEFTVEITGNENLVDGENIVTIIVKSKDGEKTTEYKIKVNKEAKVVEAVTTPVLDETPSTGEDNSKEMIKIAIVGFVTLIAVAGIAFAIIEYKYGKKKEEKASFASVGFENDDNEKEDVLESLRTNSYEDVEEDLKDSVQENTEIKAAETITNYEPTYTSKFDDKEESTERVAKSRRTEKSSKTRAKRAKVRDEEFEDVEETFELLKEEDTSSRKRGKHF